jgi:hypothetical protein
MPGIRDLSSRQTQNVVKDMEIGQPPSLRFNVLAIFFADVFLRASDFSSRTWAVVQARLFDVLFKEYSPGATAAGRQTARCQRFRVHCRRRADFGRHYGTNNKTFFGTQPFNSDFQLQELRLGLNYQLASA